MAGPAEVNRGLKGIRFEGHIDPDEIERAMRFTAKDDTLALIRLPDDKFTIRMHDEVTKGGLTLVADPATEEEPCPPLGQGIQPTW